MQPVSTTPAELVAKFAAGVVDTSGKFAAGAIDTDRSFAVCVVDTSDKFATGVIDTGGAPLLATRIFKKIQSVIFRGLVEVIYEKNLK